MGSQIAETCDVKGHEELSKVKRFCNSRCIGQKRNLQIGKYVLRKQRADYPFQREENIQSELFQSDLEQMSCLLCLARVKSRSTFFDILAV
jgi:hypothetical protein